MEHIGDEPISKIAPLVLLDERMLHDVILVLDCFLCIHDSALRVHCHAHTIESAKIRRIFEITKKNNKIFQRPLAYYAKLTTAMAYYSFYRGIKERRIFSNNQILEQRASAISQRPWAY